MGPYDREGTRLSTGRILLVGDIHLADRPPSSCTETYLEDLFDLLEQTVELEEELDCDGTIWAGDVFHVKAPTRTSHSIVQRVITLGNRYRSWWIVPGNHDMQNDRIESLPKQPLGTLFKAGAYMLGADCRVAPGPDSPYVRGVPWQQDWTNYTPTMAGAGVHLVVAHAPIYPAPPPHDEYYDPARWSERQQRGHVFYGHVHDDHGIYERDGVVFCNHGALSRGSLHESELTRQVAVTTWSPHEGFRRHNLRAKPASEVFRLVEKTQEKEAQLKLDAFLDSIGGTVLDVVSIESVMDAIRTDKVKPEVRDVIRELLEGAS